MLLLFLIILLLLVILVTKPLRRSGGSSTPATSAPGAGLALPDIGIDAGIQRLGRRKVRLRMAQA